MTYRRLNVEFVFFVVLPGNRKIKRDNKMIFVIIFRVQFFLISRKSYRVAMNKIEIKNTPRGQKMNSEGGRLSA